MRALSSLIMGLWFYKYLKKAMRRPWHFSNVLLGDESFVKCINTQIDIFLSINDTSDFSKFTLWESLKAFLRGKQGEARSRKQRLKDLSDQIKQLDLKNSIAPMRDFSKERLSLQTEFDPITTRHTEQLLLQSRSSLHKHSDKAGRFLAQQVRQSMTSTLITNIRKPDGQISNDLRK